MDRKKGTSRPDPVPAPAAEAVVAYRELAPTPELRGRVRAFFSFTHAGMARPAGRGVLREVIFARGDSFCSPVFADAGASLVLELGASVRLGGDWTSGTPLAARVIGPLRSARPGGDDARSEMVGAYLEPGASAVLLGVPAGEIADRVVGLDDVWGPGAAGLAGELAELDEGGRLEGLEAALLARIRRAPQQQPLAGVDVSGLARRVRAQPGHISVPRMADAAGVSRRHLTRVFRQVLGMGPKRFCRLARFQAALAFAGSPGRVAWARVAAQLGYADQSHMIAEFREFSSLTPDTLASRPWFHPFILEARARFGGARSG